MTFVGREEELRTLNELIDKNSFQMAVIYGRRRVGKTALIMHVCNMSSQRALVFTAREQSSANNLADFSQAIYEFFGIPSSAGAIGNWLDAFTFIAKQAQSETDQPFIFVFDEFPYAAATEKSLPSVLQIAIDHAFKQTNITLILCGSNEGFMESDVLGAKSPLYGRRTAQMRLKPFDLFTATKLMPSHSTWEDKVHYYAALGGTPYYLEQLDESRSFSENIAALCFRTSGILYEEPAMLMRQELREPALYNSILNAIGAGQTRPKEIAEKAGIDANTVGAYLKTLSALGLIQRTVPFGEDASRSRKGLWMFKDPFFDFWYHFVNPYVPLIESGATAGAVRYATSGGVFETYVGTQFEDMCMQWLLRECREGRLDFQPTAFGKWWGNDPVAREQTDIDIVMEDSFDRKLLLGECKWRNSFYESEAIDKLKRRTALIDFKGETAYYLFSKQHVSEGTRAKADSDHSLTLVDAQTMLES